MDKLEEEARKKKKGGNPGPSMCEYLEKYEETSQMEKNRDRNETSIGIVKYAAMHQT